MIVIFRSHASIEPVTMVIKIDDALIAKLAMHGRFLNVYAAYPTKLGDVVVCFYAFTNLGVTSHIVLYTMASQVASQSLIYRVDLTAPESKVGRGSPAYQNADGARNRCRERKDWCGK
jgi:hypothetical protein